MWLLFLDQHWYMVAGDTLLELIASDIVFEPWFGLVRRGAQSPVDASEVFAQRAVVEFMLLNHNKDLFTNENHSKLTF